MNQDMCKSLHRNVSGRMGQRADQSGTQLRWDIAPWIWSVFRHGFSGTGGGGEKGQKDHIPLPTGCSISGSPVFPAHALALCCKQTLNHLLLKARRAKKKKSKTVQSALLLKILPLWAHRWVFGFVGLNAYINSLCVCICTSVQVSQSE